jgi:hypothetical protein
VSEHLDPIDDWLRTDVELLSPPAGTFDRVHRRAKRRKTMVAMTAAAGAVVLIAAGATLPHFVSLPGSGPPSAKIGRSTGHHHSPKAQVPKSTGRAKAPAKRLSLANLSLNGGNFPAAANFAPTSITFVGGASGAVIGQTTTSCPAGHTCTTVAGTLNYGKSWSWIGAPPAGGPAGDTGVSQIRFHDDDNGWAFGPALYRTHDGGASWTKVTGLPGRVIDLATVGITAFAVVAHCSGTGASYAAGCTSFALYTSPYNVSDWKPVPGAAGRQPVRPGDLQLTGQYGYLLAGSVLYAGSSATGAWHAVKITSTTVPGCLSVAGRPGSGTGLLAPGSNAEVYLVCQPPDGQATLYQSADSGQSWTASGPVTAPGAPASLAVAPPPTGNQANGPVVLATSSGIYYRSSGEWVAASLGGPGPAGGFSFVGMTTALLGVAVPANPELKKIYLTSDGGVTWHAKPIS